MNQKKSTFNVLFFLKRKAVKSNLWPLIEDQSSIFELL